MGNEASDRRLKESPTRGQRPKNVDRLWEGMHQTANAGRAFQKTQKQPNPDPSQMTLKKSGAQNILVL